VSNTGVVCAIVFVLLSVVIIFTTFETSERGSAIVAELVVTVFSDITDDGWIIDPVDILSTTAVDCELSTDGCIDCVDASVVVVSGICVAVLTN
jgi:hypothetical protein